MSTVRLTGINTRTYEFSFSQVGPKGREGLIGNLIVRGHTDGPEGVGVFSGRNIILLDDVLTTGATLTEATRTLKSAGARNIIWVVVAH